MINSEPLVEVTLILMVTTSVAPAVIIGFPVIVPVAFALVMTAVAPAMVNRLVPQASEPPFKVIVLLVIVTAAVTVTVPV